MWTHYRVLRGKVSILQSVYMYISICTVLLNLNQVVKYVNQLQNGKWVIFVIFMGTINQYGDNFMSPRS